MTAKGSDGSVLGTWNYRYWYDPHYLETQFNPPTYMTGGKYLERVYDAANNPADPSAKYTRYTYTQALSGWYRPDGTAEVLLEYITDFGPGYSRVKKRKDGAGNSVSVSYTFASSGDERTVARVTDERGIQSDWAFDGSSRLVRRRNLADGKERGWRYYPADADPATVDGLLQIVDFKDGTFEQYWYDSRGNPTKVKDRYNAHTYTTYDNSDRLIEERDGRSANSSDNTYLTTTEYEGSTRNVKKVTPPSPLSPSTYEYTTGTEPATGGGSQPAGLLKKKVSPSEGTTTFSYRSNGDLYQMVDALGLTTTYAYDSFGRERYRTESGSGVPGGATWETHYDTAGRVDWTTEPTVLNPIDEQSRKLKTITTYDVNGWVRKVEQQDALNPSVTRYTSTDYWPNGLERSVTSLKQGSETVTSSTEYDGAGNVTAVVDQNGNRYEKTYDVHGYPDKTTLKGYQDDPAAGSAPYDLVVSDEDYDASGRLVRGKDAEGRVTEYSGFDVGDQPRFVVLKGFQERSAAEGGSGAVADLQLQANTYDKAGNLTERKEGNGLRTTRWSYYPAGLKAWEEVARPEGVDRRTGWSYNAGGLVEREVRKSLGVAGVADRETRTYYKNSTDVVAQTEVELASGDLVTELTSDARGNVIKSKDPEGAETSYGFDVLGRSSTEVLPAVMVESNGSAPVSASPATTTGYDAYGRVNAKRDANSNVTWFGYDFLDRQTTITHPSYAPPDGGATVTPTETFGYDNVGNLVSKTDRRGRVSVFSFDRLNRAWRSSTPGTAPGVPAVEFTLYDRVGNVTKVTDPTGAVWW